jgi:hypothetical protein
MTRRIIICAVAALVIVMGQSTAASAKPMPDAGPDVLSIYYDLDEMCRGWSGDSSHTDEVCDVRLKVEKLLGKLGYCYGKKKDFAPGGGGRARAEWHKCTPQSYYKP